MSSPTRVATPDLPAADHVGAHEVVRFPDGSIDQEYYRLLAQQLRAEQVRTVLAVVAKRARSLTARIRTAWSFRSMPMASAPLLAAPDGDRSRVAGSLPEQKIPPEERPSADQYIPHGERPC